MLASFALAFQPYGPDRLRSRGGCRLGAREVRWQDRALGCNPGTVAVTNEPTRVLPLGDTVGPIAHAGYRPADLAEPTARLIERDYPWGPRRDIPRHNWQFAPDGALRERIEVPG